MDRVDMELLLASQALLDRGLITKAGGLLPERGNDFAGMTNVLDVNSGSGAWAVRVANDNPALEVIGMECNRDLIHYAEGQAEAQCLENVEFARINWTPTEMPFPDGYFDVVNARFLAFLLRADEWPAFMKECWRIIKPGGYLRVTEMEWGMSNSSVLDELSALFLQALKKVGQSLSLSGRHLGAVAKLEHFIKQAEFDLIQRSAFVDDFASGQHLPADPALRVEMMRRSMVPLILAEGIATKVEVDHLLRLIENDLGEDFCGVMFYLTIFGVKPE